MRFTRWLFRYIAVFAGLAAGLGKLMELPEEVLTYGPAGMGHEVLYLFGSVQLGAALLMLFARTRAAGGVLLSATFGVSAYILFQDEQTRAAMITGALCLAAFAAAFWTRDMIRSGGRAYVQPGPEIWR